MAISSNDQPVQDTSYLQDYEYSIQLNRWLLKPIGVWPKLTDSTRTEKVLLKVLNIVCHSLIIFTFAPCLLFILFEETSMQTRIKAIGPMSHWLMGELNYCFLSMRTKDILHCIQHIENDWRMVKRASDRELMLKNVKVGRLIACVAAICMNLGTCSYNVITGFQKIVFHVGNESFSMYRLPCPFYTKLMNVRFSPVNELVFALQLLSGFIVNSVTVGACGLGAALAMHACGQLNVMMSWLNDLVGTKGEEQKIVKKKLANIVQLHLRTLSFVWNIEKIMNLICMVELVGCTLNICMLEYYLVTEKSKETLIIYAIIYASMIFNIFIFCYIGEKLTEQCKQIGERAYMTEWYRLPHKTALGLVMIISRSSVVIKITAGKFIRISLATFGDVLKTSFTYFNMLRTVAT
ncbi:odorant receptor 4-like [Osmia bicornis bicornis]|uniref:odorant receptor 4-like n=1 Tax=Osmia bicornis bicornis TaxID=1437191 RepID=UPI001EAEFF5D|nr:odorant receptor 4-like [Osmia bicornis bicornis]